MTARTGMTDIIAELRFLCECGTADYTAGTATMWTDDQLQAVLDRHYTALQFEPMKVVPTRVSGGYQYTDYYIGHGWLEQTSGGTSVFQVQDSGGANVGTTLWSADYISGIVTFAADQTSGVAYYCTGTSYNMDGAAAEVWRKKAAHYSSAYDFSTDNHSVKRSQMYDHAVQRAEYHEMRSGENAGSICLERGDDI